MKIIDPNLIFNVNIYMSIKSLFPSSNLIEISKKAKILEKEQEFFLINDWRDNRNPKSLQQILNSYD